jgi:predicted PhzF superfamily epimerase YddE/YHI9
VATLHVLRVFCDREGRWGNPLGVFLDGTEVRPSERQRVAYELGYSETVFVDDPARGEIRIFTPGLELPFAGHPTVGAAWLLRREGHPTPSLRPPAGEVEVRQDPGSGGQVEDDPESGGQVEDDADGVTFVAARPEWSPAWEMRRLPDPTAVEALGEPPPEQGLLPYFWAWEDEKAGLVRSRCFSLEDKIGEDEATGSAAIVLAAELGRELRIRQGEGSLLHARPLGDGRAEVGGRVVLDEVRDVRVGGSMVP